MDYAFSSSGDWRYMFGLAAIPSIGLIIGMWRLPDSPRWLISKSKVEQAKQILQRTRTVSDVSPEITDIQKSMEQQGAGGMKGLFQPSVRMPMIVGLGLAVFQQITGINTVIYYAPTIFKFAGISATGPAILAGAGLTMVMWLNAFFALLGRRWDTEQPPTPRLPKKNLRSFADNFPPLLHNRTMKSLCPKAPLQARNGN